MNQVDIRHFNRVSNKQPCLQTAKKLLAHNLQSFATAAQFDATGAQRWTF